MTSKSFLSLLRSQHQVLRGRGIRATNAGLTLVEAMIATVFFGLAIAALFPFFAGYQTGTLANESQLGAVAVSQQILDELRRVDVATLPSSGTSTVLPSGTDTTALTYLGKQYSAVITYCDRSPSPCDANTRQIQVQVSQNGRPVYTVETLFTKFETPS